MLYLHYSQTCVDQTCEKINSDAANITQSDETSDVVKVHWKVCEFEICKNTVKTIEMQRLTTTVKFWTSDIHRPDTEATKAIASMPYGHCLSALEMLQ